MRRQPVRYTVGGSDENRHYDTYLTDEIQSFDSANVPFSPLLDLGENPGLDQGTSRDHYSIHTTLFNTGPVALSRESIAATEDGDAWN